MKNKKSADILEGKVRKEKTMVMFELPFLKDSFRSKLEGKNQLLPFLTELGFDITIKPSERDEADRRDWYEMFEEFYINGAKATAYFINASSTGKKAFGGDWAPRKTRFVTIAFDSKHLFDLYVNKPLDKIALIKRINLLIDDIKQREQAHTDRQENKRQLLSSLIEKYKGITGFDSIAVQDGMLNIYTSIGQFAVNSAGNVTGYNIELPKIETREQLMTIDKVIADMQRRIFDITNAIENIAVTKGAPGIEVNSSNGHANNRGGTINIM